MQIVDNGTKDAAIVDPVDPELVLKTVGEQSVQLKAILTTHHHWDHAGGNQKLVSKYPGPLKVYGGDDRIGGLTDKVKQDDVLQLGNLSIRCLFTPCHTSGHICYYIDTADEKAVFTGDTLFSGGCGRFFEGTAAQMYDALIKKLSQLPDETNVYCGHEYTLQNLSFGKHVEPKNQDILSKIISAEALRQQNSPTVCIQSSAGFALNNCVFHLVRSHRRLAKRNRSIRSCVSSRRTCNSLQGKPTRSRRWERFVRQRILSNKMGEFVYSMSTCSHSCFTDPGNKKRRKVRKTNFSKFVFLFFGFSFQINYTLTFTYTKLVVCRAKKKAKIKKPSKEAFLPRRRWHLAAIDCVCRIIVVIVIVRVEDSREIVVHGRAHRNPRNHVPAAVTKELCIRKSSSRLLAARVSQTIRKSMKLDKSTINLSSERKHRTAWAGPKCKRTDNICKFRLVFQ